MPKLITSSSRVTEVSAADPSDALRHFERLLALETDCWDVHESTKNGTSNFVLLDVRGPQSFHMGHVPGATNLPHGKINERNLSSYPADTLFVVYCDGPHCNGADRAAANLARLGRKVKKMIGGIEGWKDEGFTLTSSQAVDAIGHIVPSIGREIVNQDQKQVDFGPRVSVPVTENAGASLDAGRTQIAFSVIATQTRVIFGADEILARLTIVQMVLPPTSR